MSRPIKRAAVLNLFVNSRFVCDHCGQETKINLRCRKCKKLVNPENVHFHRLITKAQGGKEAPSNIIMLCKDCHFKIEKIRQQKGSNTALEQFMKEKTV